MEALEKGHSQVRVALINTKDTKRARHLLSCFAAGLRRHGDEAVQVTSPSDVRLLLSADAGVQVCFVNRSHAGQPHDLFRVLVYDKMKAAGRRLLVIDTGFVRDQYDFELAARIPGSTVKFEPGQAKTFAQFDRMMYYQVGYEGIKNFANYYNAGSPPDRWDSLHVEIAPWRKAGSHILLLGQSEHGQSSQHVSVMTWYGTAVAALRCVTARTIVMRQHPRVSIIRTSSRRVRNERHKIMATIGVSPGSFRWSSFPRLERDLVDAWCAVAFSTTAAVKSVLAGIPVFVGSKVCMAFPVSAGALAQVETPALCDRKQWAHDLAYAQWNCFELSNGACWGHLRPHALEAPQYPDWM